MVFNTRMQGCKSNTFSARPGTRSPYILSSVYLDYGPGPVGTHTVGLVLDRSQAERNVTKIASVSVTPAIIPHGYAHDFTHQKKLDKAFFGSRWSRMKSDKLTQVM